MRYSSCVVRRSWLFAVVVTAALMADPAAAADCNGNGVDDASDISNGTSSDCNGNGIPDSCDIFPVAFSPLPGSPFGVVTEPTGLTAADLDGDGVKDLAVVSTPFNDGWVTVFLSAGLPSFQEQVFSPTMTNNAPKAVVAGDFDGDTGPDIAVLYYGGAMEIGGVDVFANPAYNQPLLGGSLILLASSPFIGPFRPTGFTAADFDGDGDLDLGVAAMLDVSVLLNNGAGALAHAPNSPFFPNTSPRAITSGDFNADGRPDLAITDIAANDVIIALNAGAAQFPTGVHVATGLKPVAIAAADLDGDGDLDLVTANETAGSVTILRNTAGTFALLGSFAVGQAPGGVATADFDLDGDQDVVVTNTADDTVSVMLGPSFTASRRFETGGAEPGPIIATDLDGDGRADLAVANTRSNTVSVLIAAAGASADGDADGIPDECLPVGCGAGLFSLTPLTLALWCALKSTGCRRVRKP